VVFGSLQPKNSAAAGVADKANAVTAKASPLANVRIGSPQSISVKLSLTLALMVNVRPFWKFRQLLGGCRGLA
jgi:hypothetical protein